jgi:hypothetical protein
VSGQLSSGITGTNGNVGIRRTADGGIVGSFYTDGTQTIVKEHTGTGGVLLNGFDTTSLKWMGNASQPRVGIGFNGTINATCHIKGAFATTATSSLLIENSASTELFRVRDNGNVGINTTTDAGFRLDVNGIGRFGVGAASSSVTIGQTAVNNGYIINATGYAASQYAYRFNNINGGVALFGGNNQTVIHRLDGGYQGSTTLQINGSSTVSGTSQLTSSILELNSTIQGFLPPRMTTTQKNAIASPAAGLMVYDTTLNVISYYNGTIWI